MDLIRTARDYADRTDRGMQHDAAPRANPKPAKTICQFLSGMISPNCRPEAVDGAARRLIDRDRRRGATRGTFVDLDLRSTPPASTPSHASKDPMDTPPHRPNT